MNEDEGPKASHISPFGSIRRVDEQGNGYWSARDLAKILVYNDFRNFQDVLKKAQIACEQSGQAVLDHFGDVTDMINVGKGASRKRSNVHLSRYACYLIVQNADPSKPIVALGQTYFAVQTRRQELADELAALPEDQKRLILRSQMAIFNHQLAETASAKRCNLPAFVLPLRRTAGQHTKGASYEHHSHHHRARHSQYYRPRKFPAWTNLLQ